MSGEKNKTRLESRKEGAKPANGSGTKLRKRLGISLTLILVTGLFIGYQVFIIDNVNLFLSSKAANTSIPTSLPTARSPDWSELEAGDGPTLTWRQANLPGVLLDGLVSKPLLFDGELFYFVGKDGIFASSDGESWRDTGFRLPGTGASWVDVAAWDGMLVVATSLPEILTWNRKSDSTSRFTPHILKDGNRPLRNAVAVGPQGALVVYFGNASSSIVISAFISANGQDWTEVNADPFNSGQYEGVVAFNEGFLYRQRSGNIWFSGDGHTWAEWFADSSSGREMIPNGMTTWEGNVLAYPSNVYTGPSVGLGPYSLLKTDSEHHLPESGLPPLEGRYIGLGGEISAGPIGIVTAFGWDPHMRTEQASYGCCEEDRMIGIVEFSADGVNWTRRLLPEGVFYINGLAAGSDRVLMFEIAYFGNIAPILWIGFSESD